MAIKVPEDYLMPETRQGEYLDEKKKKLFKISIDILEEIKRICEKYNLRYYAAYGTLLGTIRHKGFIPWDDDMDLWMPREDFDRFQEVAKDELPSRYFLQTPVTDPCYVMDAVKVRDSKTTATVQWQLDARLNINMGIWVTIFPLDGAYDNDYQVESILARKWLFQRIQEVAYRKVNESLKSLLLHWLFRILIAAMGLKRFNQVRNKWNYLLPFSSSKDCTSLWCLRGYNEFKCPTKVFKEWIDVPFEYTTIRVPKDYETILKALYGDWQVPIKGTADHEYADLEPDIPWNDFLREKYGWKV